jgi:predicted transcriptional regulator
MKKVKLLRILIKEKALVRLLKTIGNKEYHTRELLKMLGEYGYGHKLLMKAESNGLVERKKIKNKIYNKLTKEGKEIIKLAKEIRV